MTWFPDCIEVFSIRTFAGAHAVVSRSGPDDPAKRPQDHWPMPGSLVSYWWVHWANSLSFWEAKLKSGNQSGNVMSQCLVLCESMQRQVQSDTSFLCTSWYQHIQLNLAFLHLNINQSLCHKNIPSSSAKLLNSLITLRPAGVNLSMSVSWFRHGFDAAKHTQFGWRRAPIGLLLLGFATWKSDFSYRINRPSQSKMLPKYIGKAESTNILSKSIKK